MHKFNDKAVFLLSRLVDWTNNGIAYEADQRHAEIILGYFLKVAIDLGTLKDARTNLFENSRPIH